MRNSSFVKRSAGRLKPCGFVERNHRDLSVREISCAFDFWAAATALSRSFLPIPFLRNVFSTAIRPIFARLPVMTNRAVPAVLSPT